MTTAPAAEPRLLSFAAANSLDAGPVGTVRAAAAAGFDAVGLRLEGAHLAPAALAELARVVADEAIAVLDIEVVRLRDADISTFEPLLDAGAALAARHVIAMSYDDDRARTVDAFCRLCDAAGERGLVVALEFLPLTGIASLGDAASVLTAAGRSNSCLIVDALHLSRSGGAPKDLRSYEELVGYLQICDAPAAVPDDPERIRFEARHDRLPPGDGGLPLAQLLAALPGRPVSVEVQSDTTARSTAPLDRAIRLRQAAERVGVVARGRTL